MLLASLWGGLVALPVAAQEPPPLFEQVRVLRSSAVTQDIPVVRFNGVAWGDYDGDRDFDLFVTGRVNDAGRLLPFSQLYLNNGSTFIQVFDPDAFMGFRNVPVTVYADALNVALPILEDVWQSAVAWGDYDNDGDLDVLATGVTATEAYSTHLYENIPDSNVPTVDRFARRFSWPGVREGDLAWADYDGDGDLDFVMSGTGEDGRPVTALYENRVRPGGGFVRRDDASLVALHFSSVDWGDYDNDGDPDLLVTGMAEPQAFVTRLYRNEGNGTFTDVDAGLKGLLFASVAWGDYDADGDLDILLSGARLHPFILKGEIKIYENTGSGFVDDMVTLEGPFEGSPAVGRFQGSAGWGDYNNDGYLDFFVSGIEQPNDAPGGEVYRYTGGNHFTNVPTGFSFPDHGPGSFAGGLFGSTFWGDFDDDNDLDLFIVGDRTGGVQLVTLRNYLPLYPANTLPAAPSGLQAAPQGSSVTLSWNAASDAQTPASGLNYNLRVGTTPGGVDVVAPMADPDTGYRLVAARGNVGPNLRWTLKDLSPGVYYWSVQAIDASYKGSPFAAEGTFTIL